MKRLSTLLPRVSALEAAMLAIVCNCRRGQETIYHTAADLAAIMAVPCPVHTVRDLGCLLWLPPSSPLRSEDGTLCTCPPCAARAWREGRRGPLIREEQEEECRSWEQQLTGEEMNKVHQNQLQVKRLLRLYVWKKRRMHASSAMPGKKEGW